MKAAVIMNQITKILLVVIIVLSVVGMVDSGYAVMLHYREIDDSFCNVSETVNCDVVNQSRYSEVYLSWGSPTSDSRALNIPVAGIGFAGYLLYGFLAGSLLAGLRYKGLAVPALIIAAAAGVVFSLVLTYIEFFILEAVCILCVVSQVLVILILAAAIGVAATLRQPR